MAATCSLQFSCKRYKMMIVAVCLLLVLFHSAVQGHPEVSIQLLNELNSTFESSTVTDSDHDFLTPFMEESSGNFEESECSYAVLHSSVKRLTQFADQCTNSLVFENCCQPKYLSYQRLSPPVYLMRLGNRIQPVYCDMTSEKEGWMVILRRSAKESEDDRPWARRIKGYKNGFGKVDKEFWMGLEDIHYFTQKAPTELLVELRKNVEGQKKPEVYFAHYHNFSLETGSSRAISQNYYVLRVSGYDDSSTLPDSLSHSDGFGFKSYSVYYPKDAAVTKQYSTASCTRSFDDNWWHGTKGNETCTKVSFFRASNRPAWTSDRTRMTIPEGHILWEIDGVKETFDFVEMKIRPKIWECGETHDLQMVQRSMLSQRYD